MRLREWIRKGDRAPRLLVAARFARELLPGDSELGDPLSIAGNEPPHLLAQAAVARLRDFGRITDGAVVDRGGRVVKRLGDGAMAAFTVVRGAVEAARRACRDVAAMEVEGYHPALRAGVHVGRPRRLGGDYLGVDVNVAARIAEAAKASEVLISEAARERLPAAAYALRKRRRFKAKGAPGDLAVYTVG